MSNESPEQLHTATKIQNDLLLRAARGEQIERPPVWLMRQAGRILPEYRELRASVSGFKELVETPSLVAEVTVQPVTRLGVDAAIIFSDILVIPEAMGLPYLMEHGFGPRFEETIKSASDIDALRIADPASDLAYVLEGVRLTKERLAGSIPLIGFAGAPWTIMSYMVEGSGSKTFSKARRMLHVAPLEAERLLDKITESTIAYLKAKVAAGVDIIQVFDSWAGILSPEQYSRFAMPCLRRICAAITEVPVIVFAKDAWFALSEIAELDCQVIGLDWHISASHARSACGTGKVFQGNLDPTQLYAPAEKVAEATKRLLTDFGVPHIANLGHGVYPDTPLEGVHAFIETVKGYKAS